MHLKSISMKGFKSFPERTRLTFSPGVSVIVGPNGCGKSNITDAVLWALGEQSPTAVRGQSMQDVIFAGGKGQSRRRFAEVEVVIDNAEGRANSEFSEISILRRIDRNGDGEYRLNGARCRLADIVEALADTNLGREMHSVISQGRVEAIVNSKPRERRMLIEEAAGLGKHRKRRRRAQLKLERTRENLERALDVEREARSRLRPLKAQAEAAERHARLAREEAELRSRLLASELRRHQDALGDAEAAAAKARAGRDEVEGRLEEARETRGAIEERVAAGEEERRRRAERLLELRGAIERVGARAEAVAHADRELRGALQERQLRLDELGGELELEGDADIRVAELEAELKQLGGERGDLKTAGEALARAERAHGLARAEAERASQRRSALAGELAAVEAKLAAAAAEDGEQVLAGMIEAGSGLELAVSAALGERLRARVVDSLEQGADHLREADGAARALVAGNGAETLDEPPADGARRLLDLLEVEEPARPVLERLLANAWLVPELDEVPEDFEGIAVTADGACYDGAARELRRLPRAGTDPALAARSAREDLASRLAERDRTEQRARNELEAAEQAFAAAREAYERAAGPAAQGPEALRRAQLGAELAAERRHAKAEATAREARGRDRELLERRIELESRTLPGLAQLADSLLTLKGALEARLAALQGGGEGGDGEEIAAQLRECSQREYGIQAELREAGETLRAVEVEAAQLRERRDEAAHELGKLAAELEEELGPAEALLDEDARGEIEAKLGRLGRRREQIGPVNPLAKREYEEERERIREISEQRQDLERALAELRSLIRRTDREITASFEQTFEATARNFEEMAAELFPGGRGRLRRVELGPRALEQPAAEQDRDEDADDEDGGGPRRDETGVEIEVTPAGKSMRRLSLLSGGEKSLVALAFVFAVLMARPCPFYILDEVEAALDDINLDRFLRLVRRFSERSQFVIVTHQKLTMDAADVLYGVSMGGDGITKVVSRKLPAADEEPPAEHDAAVAAADAWSAPQEAEEAA